MKLEPGTRFYVRKVLTFWDGIEAMGLGVQGPHRSIGMLLVYKDLEAFLEQFPGEDFSIIEVADAVSEPK